ncbi:hypothetical protein I6H08_03990 [Burkholderia gladioli]|uniref:Uncharacterized protein n=1 Tax=Burkholderia gladioli TaxID=28095 RepID=A0AAW3ETG9_BURGA|nr:hypothetical protein [Burkholderia gladioli]KGC11114.1 hypothetical protein DM48_7463 [Burkholderia gladioli]QPQ84234.1 hypothetical protein I6H08_03990 [Burkholderia gladioli]
MTYHVSDVNKTLHNRLPYAFVALNCPVVLFDFAGANTSPKETGTLTKSGLLAVRRI